MVQTKKTTRSNIWSMWSQNIMIFQVRIALRRTIVISSVWHFDNISRSHHQSYVKSYCQPRDWSLSLHELRKQTFVTV